MITENQIATIEFLAAPSTHSGLPVERIDTHASIVFLAGNRAWKLKRAVRYDYLDFSTPARRRAMCEAEVRINRRTAPCLYRGVVAVVRGPDGSLALGGPGIPLDWVVEMNRFNQDGLFDRLAGRGALDLELMPPLATAIARLHRVADRRSDHGGRGGTAWVIDGNARGFAEEGTGILDPSPATNLTKQSHVALERHASELDRRRASGFVRQCHGDPSDADPDVVRTQLALGAGEVLWHRIPASGTKEDVLQRATSVVGSASDDTSVPVAAGSI